MEIRFKNNDERLQFIQLMDRFEIKTNFGQVDAFDLLAILQAYEKSLEDFNKLNERIASAYTYVSVAASKLEGKI